MALTSRRLRRRTRICLKCCCCFPPEVLLLLLFSWSVVVVVLLKCCCCCFPEVLFLLFSWSVVVLLKFVVVVLLKCCCCCCVLLKCCCCCSNEVLLLFSSWHPCRQGWGWPWLPSSLSSSFLSSLLPLSSLSPVSNYLYFCSCSPFSSHSLNAVLPLHSRSSSRPFPSTFYVSDLCQFFHLPQDQPILAYS